MTNKDYEKLKEKIEVGDIIRVSKPIYRLTHERHGSRLAQVIGKYPDVFVVKHFDGGFNQAIQYIDVNSMELISRKIA